VVYLVCVLKRRNYPPLVTVNRTKINKINNYLMFDSLRYSYWNETI